MRKSSENDLAAILDCFAKGREIQAATGNAGQWKAGYPSETMVLEDIALGRSYVAVASESTAGVSPGEVLATVVIQSQPDPFYEYIDGKWLNDDPYVTIHRIATNGKIKGSGKFLMDQVVQAYDNIRIDTKASNKPMLSLIKAYNFTYCGLIHVHDGSERQAFHLSKKDPNHLI